MEKLKEKKELIFVVTLIVMLAICMVILVIKNNRASNILDSLSIGKEYQKIATKINKTSKSNGTQIKILDAAIDDSFLGIRYRIKTNTELKNMIFWGIDERTEGEEPESILINNSDKSVICNDFILTYNNDYKTYRYFSKVSDKEYELFEIYLVEELKDINSVQIKLNLRKIYDSTTFNTNSSTITGNWEFDIALDKKNNTKISEYQFNKKVTIPKEITGYEKDQEIELVRVKQNNIVTMIEIKNRAQYKNDEQNPYLLINAEIVDENGETLLKKGIQYLVKEDAYLYLNKIDLNQNITINFYDEEIKDRLGSITFNVNEVNK